MHLNLRQASLGWSLVSDARWTVQLVPTDIGKSLRTERWLWPPRPARPPAPPAPRGDASDNKWRFTAVISCPQPRFNQILSVPLDQLQFRAISLLRFMGGLVGSLCKWDL